MEKMIKKTALALLAAAVVLAAGACRKEEETADSYADKLVSGEIQPENDYSDKKSSASGKETKVKKETDEDDVKEPEDEPKTDDLPSTDGDPDGTAAEVNIGMSDEEMAAFIDEAASEYKSFEFVPIGSADFFADKDLKMAVSIKDHEMSFLYSAGIKTRFSKDSMTMEYPSADGVINNEYYVYAISDEVKTTPAGYEYSYVAYGSDPITSKETAGTIGVVSRVKMADTVDMGEAAADSYIFLLETSNPGVYELFREE